MKIIKGDLILLAREGKFDVIVHGANCFTTMGAGIARAIRSEFPEAYEADARTLKGDKKKLGTLTYTTVKKNGNDLIIVNGYTQYDFIGGGVKVKYEALRSVFKGVKTLFSGKRIAYPKIGAGLAGGDWGTISKIIDEELAGEDHTLVEYAK